MFIVIMGLLLGKLAAQNPSKQQIREINSLKRALLLARTDTARIGLQYAIGVKADVTRISYWDSLLADAQLYNARLYEGKILDRIGTIYFKQNDMSKAIDFQVKGLIIVEKLGNKLEMLPIISHLIHVYYTILDRKNTLLHIYKGLKIAEELKERKAILEFYSEVALLYWSSGDSKRALQMHFKCLSESKKIGYNYGIVSALLDIGADYFALHQEEKAIPFYLQSLNYTEKLQAFPVAIYHIYNSAATAYRIMGKYDSAYYYSYKCYEHAKRINNKRAIAGSIFSIACVKHASGENKQAEKLAIQSLVISKSTNFIAELPIIYDLLEKIYIKTGHYKKALYVYKLNIAIRDSLSNEQVRTQAMEKEFAYNYEKKEQAYNILAQQNQIQTLQLKQNSFLIFGFVILLLAMSVIAYLYIKQNKYRIEHTKILMEQKLLLSQMNPHFIFNSLNSIQQFIMKGQNTQAEVYLSKFSKLIRELLESSTKENLTIQEEVEILQVYLEMESLRFGSSFDYAIDVDEKIDRQHITIPHLMIQPFVENAIWHGLLPKADNKHLQIAFDYHTAQTVQCTIDDNGVGRVVSAQKEPLSNKKSLALHLIKKRIGMINKSNKSKGGITIVDKKDTLGNSTGTTIVLVLPILKV